MHTEFWWVKSEDRQLLEDKDVDGKIILKRIFRNWNGGYVLD